MLFCFLEHRKDAGLTAALHPDAFTDTSSSKCICSSGQLQGRSRDASVCTGFRVLLSELEFTSATSLTLDAFRVHLRMHQLPYGFPIQCFMSC